MLSARRNSSLGTTRNSRNVLIVSQYPAPAPLQLQRSSTSQPASSTPVRHTGTGGLPVSRLRLSRLVSADGHADGPPRMYLLGTRLECRMPGWSRYYSGRVSAINTDGTVMVNFDDGDLRDCVQLANVHFEARTSPSTSPARVPLRGGAQVECYFEDKWLPGRIEDICTADSFSVVLCDGRILRDVIRDHLRLYKPVTSDLIPGEEIEFLRYETRSWVKGTVDESASRVIYLDEATQTPGVLPLEDLELRYPIVTMAPKELEDEDSQDATPMLLSMQERLSQSIEVGSRILITDKNGGALPRVGKADSAQVSIVNFPLPADGIIESITLRLFEPPAEENGTLDVYLFDREHIPATRAHRLSSAESSNDEGGASPQVGGGSSSADMQVTRFYVAPDLPYRPSKATIVLDPHSRAVQTVKLSPPLRGSAGQYLGLMNRKGRLNIAYTPDKKKPGESWSEKSVEVFYMMPRMVPKPFVGGPHATRDWHGRAGWYAVMVVCDPIDAVDPGWQRRCAIDAMMRRDGQNELRRITWLITSMLRDGRIDARYLLFQSPGLMKALRRLCEIDDSVVELVTQLCVAALNSPDESWKPSKMNIQPFVRLQRALRFKAWEMQAVQRGRLTANVASFQSVLRCSLTMKNLIAKMNPPQRSQSASFLRTVGVSVYPRSLEAPWAILYHIKPRETFVVSTSSVPELKSGADELEIRRNQDDDAGFRTLLHTTGPVPDVDLYFDDYNSPMAKQWKLWTSTLDNIYRSKLREIVDDDGSTVLEAVNKDSQPLQMKQAAGNWLDDLARAEGLLSAFADRKRPPASFIAEQYTIWRQWKSKIKISSPNPCPEIGAGDAPLVWNVDIPGASRLKLTWLPSSRLPDGRGTSVAIEACGTVAHGRNGLPPPIERVEGNAMRVLVTRALAFDPGEIVRQRKLAEVATFPLAQGLTNRQGDAVRVVTDRGCAQLMCDACAKVGQVGWCCQRNTALLNNEEREVTFLPIRGSWACSLCSGQNTPCNSCSLFPQSIAFYSAYARPLSSFQNQSRYETFLRKTLISGVPVKTSDGVIRRFYKFVGDMVMTGSIDATDRASDAKNTALHSIESIELVPAAQALTAIATNATSCQNRDSSTDCLQTEAEFGTSNPGSRGGGTFAFNDLGPDVILSNNDQTATRVRSFGWGTQRLSRYLDSSCGVTTITFQIDRNTSNHLFFGVVSAGFRDWSMRMVTPGSWAMRRDGSMYMDGREIPSAFVDARLVTGESLTMIVDMSSEPRSVSFLKGSTLFGKLQGLPPRVVPAISFGGYNQVVTITSFSMSNSSASLGKSQVEWGFSLEVVPEYDLFETEEAEQYVQDMMSWTFKQDRALVCHVDEVATERKMSLSEVLASHWDAFIRPQGRYHFLDSLYDEGLTNEAIGQRFEWIRALNSSLANALPLLDLSFDPSRNSSVVRDLSECSHLIFDCLKRPMWEDALECTRTEDGQFEVVLDYGRALAHRQFVDVHGRFSIFGQAFRAMNPMPPSRLRGKGQLYRATLRGMRAHDDGGPYRQSFQTYCAELLSTPGVGLFLPCANRVNEIHVNRDRWLPNPGARSAIQIAMFEFVGKLMGIALRNNEYLDLRLPSLVWKWLVNRKATLEDLRAVDLLFVNTVQTMLDVTDENDIWGDDRLLMSAGINTFTIYNLDGHLVELVPDGEKRLISTAQDRKEWAQLAIDFKLNEFNEQLEAIRRGLATVVPQRMLVLFSWDELELMVCGRPKIDLALLRSMTVYVGCSEADPHIQAFWRVLASLSEELRSLYLRFVWGRSRLPASRATWGDAPHKVSAFDSRQVGRVNVDDLLPRSHTCYFSLDLPRYSSEEILRKKLLFAIENCTEIDADQTTTGNRSAALGFELEMEAPDMVSDDTILAGLNSNTFADSHGTDLANADQAYGNHITERRFSQSSFGSELDDIDDEVCEAEVEVLARLGHDLDAINVFDFDDVIDFGEDDSD